MRRLAVLALAAVLAGCDPGDPYQGQCPTGLSNDQCRDVLVARARAQGESALRMYQADAEHTRGYLEALRDTGAAPLPAGGAK